MTVPQVINNAYLSSYLCARDNAVGNLFGGKLSAPMNAVDMKMVADALSWGLSGGAQTSDSLLGVARYLRWLCGKYFLQASVITNTGGTVQPVNPVVQTPARIDFEVSGSSLIPNGSQTLTLTNWIGYQMDFIRGGISQSTLSTQPTYFSWNSTTGVFNCYPAAVTGELFSFIPS